MELGAAGVIGMAYAAYGYNMGRFKFEAGQNMTNRHWRQNLRIKEWGVYRSDMRELFKLTTDNLSTTMVKATFFFSLIVNIMCFSIYSFPSDQTWVMIIWGNCGISATSFAILSFWLAMHGTCAASSYSVKVLTQAVRAPIPSVDETADIRQNLDKYEAATDRFMEVPGLAGALLKSAAAPGDTKPGVNSAGARGSAGRGSVFGPAASRKVVEQQERAAELLHVPEDDGMLGGGPGRGAASDSHIRLFKQVYSQYCCYDAYARVCLSAAVHETLLSVSYIGIAYHIVEYETRPTGNAIFAGIAMLIVNFAALTIYKLDLYLDKVHMRIVKYAVYAGPISVAIAAYIWESKEYPKLLPEFLICFSCMLHTSFSILLLVEAWPAGGKLKVPLNWRPVRYLDVFGWLDEEEQCGESAESWSGQQTGAGRASTERLHEHRPQEVVDPSSHGRDGNRTGDAVVGLSPGAMDQRNSTTSFMSVLAGGDDNGNEPRSPMAGVQPTSVCSVLEMAQIDAIPDTVYAPPGTTTRADTSTEPVVLDAMPKSPGSRYIVSELPWRYFKQLCIFHIGLWIASTAWIICQQVSVHTGGHTFFLFSGALPAQGLYDSPSDSAALAVKWPHNFFRPSAFACFGQHLLVSEADALYVSDLSGFDTAQKSFSQRKQLEFNRLLQSMLPSGGKSLTALSADRFLVLEADGKSVVELTLPVPLLEAASRQALDAVSTRRWIFGPRLGSSVRAIVSVSADDVTAADMCQQLEGTNDSAWAVYAATEDGRIVLLCPGDAHSQLNPALVVMQSSIPGAPATRNFFSKIRPQETILGMHVGRTGELWSMVRRDMPKMPANKGNVSIGSGGDQVITELRVWYGLLGGASQSSQMPLSRRWRLPSGHQWLPGLCATPMSAGLWHGGGLVAVAERREAGMSGQPELYYFGSDTSSASE